MTMTPSAAAAMRGDGQPVPDTFMRKGSQGGSEEQLANLLGLVSLGLGLAGIAAPGSVARMVGVPDTDENRNVIRGVGLREIAAGVGILAQPRPTEWVWGRVAGDLMDLALLGSALQSERSDRNRVLGATAVVAGITGLDLLCGSQLNRRTGVNGANGAQGHIRRSKTITINCTPEQAYSFWRNFENLPRFMKHLESVQVLDGNRSHWRANGPAGVKVEWDAEMVEDRPNELIAWRSLPGADVPNAGSVHFQAAPGNRGTEVRVEMEYQPPAGMMGAKIAHLMGKEPGQQVQDDLRAFKQVMETGEVVISEGSVSGTQFPQHAAQPPVLRDLPAAA